MRHFLMSLFVLAFSTSAMAALNSKSPIQAKKKAAVTRSTSAFKSSNKIQALKSNRKVVSNHIVVTAPSSGQNTKNAVNVGQSDCPYKKQAFSPFSREGKLVRQVANVSKPAGLNSQNLK